MAAGGLTASGWFKARFALPADTRIWDHRPVPLVSPELPKKPERPVKTPPPPLRVAPIIVDP
jgi:hypothetical protein